MENITDELIKIACIGYRFHIIIAMENELFVKNKGLICINNEAVLTKRLIKCGMGYHSVRRYGLWDKTIHKSWEIYITKLMTVLYKN